MKIPKRFDRFRHFIVDVITHTPIVQMIVLMLVLWLLFAAALYVVEARAASAAIQSYLDAAYWGLAAFSTAGIADKPSTVPGILIGGTWIVIGSIVFFGTIVATVTTYFTRPLHRPARRLIDTIEYNLEQLDELNLEELDLLKDTVDTLIENVEYLKQHQVQGGG